MADDRPNVQVIYTSAKPSSPGFGDIVREVLFVAFLIICGMFLFGGCGVAWWLW
jgi:hypothetical protein